MQACLAERQRHGIGVLRLPGFQRVQVPEDDLSFNTLMAQQPQTLSFALLDSPVGLLAWNAPLRELR
jgi:hypothetical protein